jgi:predicted dehydrogenase
MSIIKHGIVGGGPGSFIGYAHRLAAKMDDNFILIGGVFSSDYQKSLKFSSELNLDADRIYKNVDELIEKELSISREDRLQAVTIATPNYLHYDIAKKLIQNGFHVICEKPVTMTSAEAEQLEKLVKKHRVVFCLTHNYTGFPMVKEARNLIERGELGKIQKVDIQYYSGALNPVIHKKEKRKEVWRLDPRKSGISCNIGDIGTHAFNLLEYVSGLQVKKVLADLNTLYDDNPLDVDATILLRLNSAIKGVLRSSMVATGEDNNIEIKVYGDRGGLRWCEENPNYLHLLYDDKPAKMYTKGRIYNSQFSLQGSRIKWGIPEGYFEAFANLYNGAAKAIRNEKIEPGEFPTISDGVRTMKFVEAVVKSNKHGNIWVDL